VKVTKNNWKDKQKSDKLELEIKGIEAPIANAIRRIAIAEVPAMAIEHVWIENNTSVMQDEVLAHRLGLIPIWVNPNVLDQYFEFPSVSEAAPTVNSTLVFRLDIHCQRKPGTRDDDPPDEKYIGSKVYSGDLTWVPTGEQVDWFKMDPPRPTVHDILLVKMRPGQEISLVAHCKKGIGRTHAKWSPVCTASYRLMPSITLTKTIKGQDAEELAKTCPMGVFDIEDGIAVVSKPKKCTMCRECIRNPKFTASIQLAREKDHYIFAVESTGVLPPATIFSQSLQILMDKCRILEHEVSTKQTVLQ